MTVKERAQHSDFVAMRRAMVASQLRPSDVNDPAILAAFGQLPREDYVPASLAATAYMDRAVPLENGTVLAPPITHGQMLVAAEPRFGERALVVSASGYLAALVKTLGLEVTEIAPADLARQRKGAAFDLILVDGAAEQLPANLAKLLADDGRIVTGLIDQGVPRLALGRRQGDDIALMRLGEIDAAPIPLFAAPKSWSF